MIERFTTFKGGAYTIIKYALIRKIFLLSVIIKILPFLGLFSAWDLYQRSMNPVANSFLFVSD